MTYPGYGVNYQPVFNIRIGAHSIRPTMVTRMTRHPPAIACPDNPVKDKASHSRTNAARTQGRAVSEIVAKKGELSKDEPKAHSDQGLPPRIADYDKRDH